MYFATAAIQNVVVGHTAMNNNTTGSYNVAVGSGALYNCTTGTRNTSLGQSAGAAITRGTDNISIGYNAQPSTGTVSGECTLGDSAINNLRCNDTTISSLSDARDKTEVIDCPLGVDFINTLRPVKFKWQTRDGNVKDGSYEVNFIAQELQQAQSEANADYLGLIINSNPERLEARPGKLLPILVKAVQELSEQNAMLLQRIEQLEG
jgi:hypothetical protein